MGDGEVRISWKKAGNNLEENLRSHSRKSFCTDLSIICDDNEEVKAHKVILCSRSQFLKHLLLDSDQSLVQQPKIILSDVSKVCLENILSFIYHGTVSISQEHLEEFKTGLVNLGIEKPKTEKRIKNPEHTTSVKKVKLESDSFLIKEEQESDQSEADDNGYEFEQLDDNLNDGYESDDQCYGNQLAQSKAEDKIFIDEEKAENPEEIGNTVSNSKLDVKKNRKSKEEI